MNDTEQNSIGVRVGNGRYSMSFTSAALASRESLIVAELYRHTGNWEATRDRVVAENMLQMRTQNASKRICREIISRLKLLTSAQLNLVLEGMRSEQNYLLWLAVCKRYRFIHDFTRDVVREKYLRLALQLTADDYDAFFYGKAEWHPEVERVTNTTRVKQRQFVYKMMREAALLSDDHRILPAFFTPSLVAAIQKDDPLYFLIFPISDYEIREWSQ